jgi:hypothetical protein
MKRIASAQLALLLSCTSPIITSRDNVPPKLGDRIDMPKNANTLLIASAQMSPSTKLLRGAISYDVAVNDSNKIIYISTDSPTFRTPEGLGPGATLEQVLAGGGKPVVYETGWAQFSILPSGWCAAFYGSSSDDSLKGIFNPPSLSSKVSYYFKRR